MKKVVKVMSVVMMALIMLLGSVVGVFAADCDHNWVYDSGYIDVTRNCLSIITYKCSVCSETKTEEGVNSHKPSGSYKYIDQDTCMAFCKECSSWYELPYHAWDSGKIDKAPTCTSNGTLVYTCLFCNGRKTEVVSKLSHELDADGVCQLCSSDFSQETDQPVETELPEETSSVETDKAETPEETSLVETDNTEPSESTSSVEENKTDSSDVSLKQAVAVALGASLVLGISYLVVSLFKAKRG